MANAPLELKSTQECRREPYLAHCYFCFTLMIFPTVYHPRFGDVCLQMIALCTEPLIRSVQDQLQLQRDLDSLTDWASWWGMSFNPSKCTVIIISRSNSPLHKFYTLCGVVLQHVSEARYLGVLLSDDLQTAVVEARPAYHSQGQQHAGSSTAQSSPLPRKLRELAYISLVRSRLEYCAAVWDPHKITDQLALESVQRRAARFTKRDYSTPTSPVCLRCSRTYSGSLSRK